MAVAKSQKKENSKPRFEPFGRPREHDRTKIANDLVEWAKQPNSINLNKFCAVEACIPPSKLSEWANQDSYFREAYEVAKSHIAYRREEMLTSNQLHVKAYDLNACTYDYFLKKERREQAEFEAKLKQEEPSKVPEDDQKRHDRLIETLTLMQSESRTQVEDKISNS